MLPIPLLQIFFFLRLSDTATHNNQGGGVCRPVRCLWMLQLHGVVTEGQVSAAACARSGCGCVVASALLWLPLATITMARAAKAECCHNVKSRPLPYPSEGQPSSPPLPLSPALPFYNKLDNHVQWCWFE